MRADNPEDNLVPLPVFEREPVVVIHPRLLDPVLFYIAAQYQAHSSTKIGLS